MRHFLFFVMFRRVCTGVYTMYFCTNKITMITLPKSSKHPAQFIAKMFFLQLWYYFILGVCQVKIPRGWKLYLADQLILILGNPVRGRSDKSSSVSLPVQPVFSLKFGLVSGSPGSLMLHASYYLRVNFYYSVVIPSLKISVPL